MLIASGLLALLVGAAFAVLLSSVADLRALERRARRTEEVLQVANLLERRVVDLETAQRGYVITREERFLGSWRRAQAAFPTDAATLERLAGSDPQQRERARRITEATASYLRPPRGGTRPRPGQRPPPTRAGSAWTPSGPSSTASWPPSVAWRRRASGARTRPPHGPSSPRPSALAGRSCSSPCSPAT
jgi:hypothetical protein